MNHDKRRYSDPTVFKPERWLKTADGKDRPYQSFDQYAFPVFQGGPRMCLGKDLAMYTIKVLTVELLRRFRFEALSFNGVENFATDEWKKDVTLVNGEPVMSVQITSSINGNLDMRVHKRDHNLL